MEDKLKVFKLKHPIGDITELRLRTEATIKDYYGVKLGQSGEIDIKSIAQLIANLSNQPLTVIEKLKNKDWLPLAEFVASFF